MSYSSNPVCVGLKVLAKQFRLAIKIAVGWRFSLQRTASNYN
jgi:hypothetical protein